MCNAHNIPVVVVFFVLIEDLYNNKIKTFYKIHPVFQPVNSLQIIITENDNLNSADVCTDAITMQDSAIETKESDYNDLSNLPLCDPIVDNIQTPVFDNEVHVISSKKKQITSMSKYKFCYSHQV